MTWYVYVRTRDGNTQAVEVGDEAEARKVLSDTQEVMALRPRPVTIAEKLLVPSQDIASVWIDETEN